MSSYQSIKQIQDGFIEAMYFADGADSSFKDDQGHYLDGLFDRDLDLSDQANENVTNLLTKVVEWLPKGVFEHLSLDRIGNNLYYAIGGHGVGFFDEDSLPSEVKETINKIDFNCHVYIEICENDSNELDFTFRV